MRQVDILASIRHPNIVLFMGVCTSPPCLVKAALLSLCLSMQGNCCKPLSVFEAEPYLQVTEFCARGSLYDVLRKVRAVHHRFKATHDTS